jgi:uncharacterized protein
MILDGLFHPRQWASRLALRTGLQSSKIEIDRVAFPVSGSSGPPLRIAFASDFHAGATTNRRVLEAACEAIASEKPDVLLLGGDFVTTRAGYIDHLAPLIAAIPAPLGKFGVFGNHDRRANRDVLTRALEKAGVQMLCNESVTLPAPYGHVAIIGLDDPVRGHPEFPVGIRAPLQIVLMHSPDGILYLDDHPFDLALCGHTHGGQIVIGGVKPYMPDGKLSRAYAGGIYRIGDDAQRTLLVSRGVGCSTIPIRLGARPQIHLLAVG